MFKFFKNLIVKTAVAIEEKELKATEDKIKAETDAKESAERVRQEAKVFFNELKIAIEDYFVPHVKNLEATIPDLHIKVGDRVVVNKYELLSKHSGNGWDTGARALCGMYYKFNEDHYGPIYAKITNIHVSDSYFWEQVDKFLENLGYNWMGYHNPPRDEELLKYVGSRFKNWFDKRRMLSMSDNLGFYLDASFQLENVDFKPQWGLNVYSFLQVDSEEAKKTIDAWEMGKELYELRQEFNKKEAELKEQQASRIQ